MLDSCGLQRLDDHVSYSHPCHGFHPEVIIVLVVAADTTGRRLAGSRRSMGRGVKVTGGQIDKAGLLQIGESGF